MIFISSVIFSERKSPELHLSPSGEKPAFLQLFENHAAVNQSRLSSIPASWGLGHPRGPGWRPLLRARRGWRGEAWIPQFSPFCPTSHLEGPAQSSKLRRSAWHLYPRQRVPAERRAAPTASEPTSALHIPVHSVWPAARGPLSNVRDKRPGHVWLAAPPPFSCNHLINQVCITLTEPSRQRSGGAA